MSLMSKMERKLRFLSKVNLTIYFIIIYAVGFFISYTVPGVMNYLVFQPELILQGQVWRLITWLFRSNDSGIFMVLITCFIYFSISKALEQTIGTFRVNFFLISGTIIQIIMGFIFYAVMPVPDCMYVVILNPYYLYAMFFVLFAMMYPDARFLFMFIIPIRGRWLVFLTLGLYLLDVFRAFAAGLAGYGWMIVFMISAEILNIVLFMALSQQKFRRRNEKIVNMRAYGSNKSNEQVPRHKCEICGRTNLTNPELDFRYCSKCAGNHEYCMEHIYTHIHHTEENA